MTLELFCEKIQDKVLTLTGLTINDVSKGLSKYATENSKEFCSEAFCEYFKIENSRPIAAAFGKIIEKEFI